MDLSRTSIPFYLTLNRVKPSFVSLLVFLFLAASANGQTRTDSVVPHRHEVDSLPYAPPIVNLTHFPPLTPATPEVVAHGPRTEKKIALTFDACSTRKPSHYDERVTRVLVETKTPATIFLGGKWMEDEPEQVRYLASLSQVELANHTFLHPHLTQVPDDRIRKELLWTQEAMYSLTGRQALLFRPPYGEYDNRVVRIAAELGLTTVEYDLASGDPDIHTTAEKLVEYVTAKAKNGSIIVMHINRRGWHTAEALPRIISTLRHRGFTFVTVSDLIKDLHQHGAKQGHQQQ